MEEKETMKLNVTLDEKNTQCFQIIKNHYGFKANQSLVALLLSNEAEKIRRQKVKQICIPKDHYESLAKKAEADHLTVDEYVNRLVLEQIEEAKEVVKHGN